jgi:hypothetical protein
MNDRLVDQPAGEALRTLTRDGPFIDEGSPLRLGSREGVADKSARQEGRRTRSLRRPEYRSFAPFASSLRKAA